MIDPFSADTSFASYEDQSDQLSLDTFDASIAGGNRDLYIRHFSDYPERSGPSFTYEVADGLMKYTSYLQGSYANYLNILYGNLPESMRLNFNLNDYRERGGIRIKLEDPAPDFQATVGMTVNNNSTSFAITKTLGSGIVIDLPFFEFKSSNTPDYGYNPSNPMPDLSVLYYFSFRFRVQDELEEQMRALKVDSISILPDLFDGNGILFTKWEPLEGGYVTGGGTSSGEIEAIPSTGYLFKDWSEPYSGTSNPIVFAETVPEDLILTANFIKDLADDDSDGLSNYDELVAYGTDKDDPHSDEDQINDGLEVALSSLGFMPLVDDSAKLGILAENVNDLSLLFEEAYSATSLERYKTEGLQIAPEADGTFTVSFQPQYYDPDTKQWVHHGEPILWNSGPANESTRLMRFDLSKGHLDEVNP
jgi:hypothetical protein